MFDSADIFRLSSRYICTDTLAEVLLVPLMPLQKLLHVYNLQDTKLRDGKNQIKDDVCV
jgi:hypothetical protein